MKRMTVLLTLLAILALTFGAFVSEGHARLSSNNRRAVVLECFYALRPSYDGGCDKTINGNCVSNWNYLNNDTYAYGVVKGWYACNSSNWVTSYDGSGCYNYGAPASFYSEPATYGYGTFGRNNGSVGRAGQFKYFANLILYRSGSDQRAFPTYGTMFTNVQTNVTLAVEGDILITQNEGSGYNIPHTANREVTARHLLSVSYLQQHSYAIWKGASYYNEPYVP